jgi:hypothetical protein
MFLPKLKILPIMTLSENKGHFEKSHRIKHKKSGFSAVSVLEYNYRKGERTYIYEQLDRGYTKRYTVY